MERQPIATVTLNPALDEAIAVGTVVLGATNRCGLDALDPGGKGVNASRVIHRLRRPTVAYGFVGGVVGALLRDRLDAEGVQHDFFEVPGLTRINIMVYEHDSGRRSRLYLPGPRVEDGQANALLARLWRIPRGSTVVLGGSVPPGLPASVYRDFISTLRSRHIRTLLDTSGPALAASLDARPTLIKPNVEEAEEILGRALPTESAVLRAADELRRRGPEYVVISQGAEGAIGVGPNGAWKAIPPPVTARSTVGSGDSMLAGLAIALDEGLPFEEGLRLGTAAGAATATVPGTQLCRAADVEQLLTSVIVREAGVAVTDERSLTPSGS